MAGKISKKRAHTNVWIPQHTMESRKLWLIVCSKLLLMCTFSLSSFDSVVFWVIHTLVSVHFADFNSSSYANKNFGNILVSYIFIFSVYSKQYLHACVDVTVNAFSLWGNGFQKSGIMVWTKSKCVDGANKLWKFIHAAVNAVIFTRKRELYRENYMVQPS